MRKWNRQQLEFLNDNYSEKGLLFCSRTLNIPKASVGVMVKKMKLKYHTRWSDKDLDTLKTFYPEYGYKKAASILGFDCGRIRAKDNIVKSDNLNWRKDN